MNDMKKQRVLLIEDEKNVLESLREALSDEYDVLTAENGQEAIDVIKKSDMDVVVLDLRLPGINGLQVLRIIKNIDMTLPVIIISGSNLVHTVVDGFRYGAYDYFDKPFNVFDLKKSIRRAVNDPCIGRRTCERLLSVDMEMLIKKALDETLRHDAPLSCALQDFRERYIDLVEEKILGTGTDGFDL